jgi:choline dehydrogenase-like flavoprotein
VLGCYLMEHTSGVAAVGTRRGTAPRGAKYTSRTSENCPVPGAGLHPWQRISGGGIDALPGKSLFACTLLGFGEVPARKTNRVTLSEILKDRWGIPAARIDYAASDNEIEMALDQQSQLTSMLEQRGYRIVSQQGLASPGLSLHELGTARIGAERSNPVLNSYNKWWDVPNLLVTGRAAFPRGGFQNPTLTMMALTGRTCRYLVQELRHGDLWQNTNARLATM